MASRQDTINVFILRDRGVQSVGNIQRDFRLFGRRTSTCLSMVESFRAAVPAPGRATKTTRPFDGQRTSSLALETVSCGLRAFGLGI